MKIIVDTQDLQDAIADLQAATIARCKAQFECDRQAERETKARNKLLWLLDSSPRPTQASDAEGAKA